MRQPAFAMSRVFRSLLTLALSASLAPAAPPGWVASMGRAVDYPPAQYLTGFGVSPADKAMSPVDKLSYARGAAAKNLVQAMRVNVASEDVVDTFSRCVNKNEQLVDEYKSKTVLKSDLNLDGLRFDEYPAAKGEPAYALAILERAGAKAHYRQQFAEKMKLLVQLQKQGNQELAAQQVAVARATYSRCDQVVGEIEEVILVRQLLGDASPLAEQDLRQILSAKSESKALWDKVAATLEEAADQLALKIAAQKPPAGKVQVNALMLDDTYQYSQFSSRFRTILEAALARHTPLRPLLLGEMDFTPPSAGLSRVKAAGSGAEALLSGSYFIKANEVNIYVRLSSAKNGEALASADARMQLAAAEGLELKPRNFLQALADRKVFNKDELIGGGLRLEAWTDKGVDGLALQDGNDLKLYARVNKPCYLRFIYHLSNGARIIPERVLMNYHIGEDKVNKVVELPAQFTICAPFGSETMQFFASTDEFPPANLVKRMFGGEEYEVLADSLADINIKTRGIKKKAGEVELAEQRIALTTVPK